MLVYFIAIWSIQWPSGNILRFCGIFYGNLVYFAHFGKFWQEKSGNPGMYMLSCMQTNRQAASYAGPCTLMGFVYIYHNHRFLHYSERWQREQSYKGRPTL
jgi:hypothetical protein